MQFERNQHIIVDDYSLPQAEFETITNGFRALDIKTMSPDQVKPKEKSMWWSSLMWWNMKWWLNRWGLAEAIAIITESRIYRSEWNQKIWLAPRTFTHPALPTLLPLGRAVTKIGTIRKPNPTTIKSNFRFCLQNHRTLLNSRDVRTARPDPYEEPILATRWRSAKNRSPHLWTDDSLILCKRAHVKGYITTCTGTCSLICLSCLLLCTSHRSTSTSLHSLSTLPTWCRISRHRLPYPSVSWFISCSKSLFGTILILLLQVLW